MIEVAGEGIAESPAGGCEVVPAGDLLPGEMTGVQD
jgi:hypothetical protein